MQHHRLWPIAKHRRYVLALCSAIVAAFQGVIPCARAQVPAVLSGGPPVQVIPYVTEPGVPAFTVTPGTTNPFTGADGSGSDGSGGGTTGGSGTGSNVGSTDALSTMISQSWGAAAVANAQSLGVNPAALAAMCAAETGCQNIANTAGSSANGPFQMITSTYNAMIAAAVAANPALAGSIVSGAAGQTDPATEAAAAAEYMSQLATTLQNSGISDPTVLDVRAGYAFGGSYMAQVDAAPDSEPLGQILTGWNSQTYAQNGLTPSTTVGQWRATQTARLGAGSASQSVFVGS